MSKTQIINCKTGRIITDQKYAVKYGAEYEIFHDIKWLRRILETVIIHILLYVLHVAQ